MQVNMENTLESGKIKNFYNAQITTAVKIDGKSWTWCIDGSGV